MTGKIKLASVIFASMITIACGGGGGSTPPADSGSTPPAEGDSSPSTDSDSDSSNGSDSDSSNGGGSDSSNGGGSDSSNGGGSDSSNGGGSDSSNGGGSDSSNGGGSDSSNGGDSGSSNGGDSGSSNGGDSGSSNGGGSDSSNGGDSGSSNGGDSGSSNGGDSNPPPPPTPSHEKLFFSATGDVNQGAELWATDGTESGTVLVKDINPAGDSHPHRFTRVGNETFFVATNADNGKELWKTDGTENGTVLVKDIHPSGDSNPYLLTAFNNKLMFVANDDTDRALWLSDGTANGTVRFTNGQTNRNPVVPREMVAFNNKVYFAAASSNTASPELWVTGGTARTTGMFRINNNRLPSPHPGIPATTYVGAHVRHMVASDNSLFFIGTNQPHNGKHASFRVDTNNQVHVLGDESGISELERVSFANGDTGIAYAHNATGGNIVGFYNNNNFTQKEAITQFNPNAAKPTQLTALSDQLLFTMAGNNLWISNGSANQTLVKDGLSNIRDINTLGNKAVFVAKQTTGGANGQSDEALWITDGTTNNTVKLNESLNNESIGQFIEHGGKLYFTAATAASGQELWVTDGTLAGTKLVKNINDGSTSSDPVLTGAAPAQ